MTIGALAGFALVFVVVAWTASCAGALVLARLTPWLRGRGPAAERRAAEGAAVVPLALAALVVGALLAHAALGTDHCETHAHHVHLCLVHGAGWIERAWVVVALAVVGATIAARAALLGAAFVRGARGIRALHAISRAAGDVLLVASDRVFCFATRRGIYVSSRVWDALSADERRALVAHEAAHVAHRDLAKRALLEIALLLAAPLVAGRVRHVWQQATERRCDAEAARATGEPACVASAMLAVCRLEANHPVPALGFTPTMAELAERVAALFAAPPSGRELAAQLSRWAAGGLALVAVTCIAAAGPLHHAFETLLG